MTKTFEEQQHARRSRTTGVVGAVCVFFAACLIGWYLLQVRTGTSTSASYQYTINQSVATAVAYHENSFYEGGTAADNTAFVTPLTKEVATTFRYHFGSPQYADLTYRHSITALVRGIYAVSGKEDEAANVWTKQFTLLEPIEKKTDMGALTVQEKVVVPFEEYRLLIDQYRTTLQVPVDGEVIVTSTVKVDGVISGTSFNDTKVSTVTMPLTRQIYQPAVEYEKTANGKVTTASRKAAHDALMNGIIIGGTALGVIGTMLVVLAMRRRIFKSSYQRELERIYRLHDGIIIRTKEHPNLTGKRIVSVKSFDDMLNLEEEVKSPIVSSEAGEHATRFMIMRDDVVYMYLLGSLLTSDDEVIEEIQQAFDPPTTVAKRRPATVQHRKIQ
jgi:hypothetical protein